MQPHKTPAPQFVLDPNPTVEWPVTVSLPADGGTLEEFRFSARVRVLPDCEYETFDKKPDGHKSAAEILGDNAERLPQLVLPHASARPNRAGFLRTTGRRLKSGATCGTSGAGLAADSRRRCAPASTGGRWRA